MSELDDQVAEEVMGYALLGNYWLWHGKQWWFRDFWEPTVDLEQREQVKRRIEELGYGWQVTYTTMRQLRGFRAKVGNELERGETEGEALCKAALAAVRRDL